jgi:hypothetical protein
LAFIPALNFISKRSGRALPELPLSAETGEAKLKQPNNKARTMAKVEILFTHPICASYASLCELNEKAAFVVRNNEKAPFVLLNDVKSRSSWCE